MELIFTTRWNHKNCSQWLQRTLKMWSKTPVSTSSRGGPRDRRRSPRSSANRAPAAPAAQAAARLGSQMEMTPTPQWLLLLCPARLKPLTTPSLHSNLKRTQVSRCKIKAVCVLSTASLHKVQVSPSWNLGKKGEEKEFSFPVSAHPATTEQKKSFTACCQTHHLLSQQPGQKARLALDRQSDGRAHRLWE